MRLCPISTLAAPLLATAGVLMLFAAPARAATLTFDDITTNCADLFATAGAGSYGGFDWSVDWALECDADYQGTPVYDAITGEFLGGYGNTNGSKSGDWAVYNGFGSLSVTTTNSAAFNFVGAWFTAWSENDQATSYGATRITVEGYNNGILMGSAALDPLANDSYTYLAANLLNVDELRFLSSADFQWWLMDDFETSPVAAPIPEPASLILLGTGLYAAAARRRAQRCSNRS